MLGEMSPCVQMCADVQMGGGEKEGAAAAAVIQYQAGCLGSTAICTRQPRNAFHNIHFKLVELN